MDTSKAEFLSRAAALDRAAPHVRARLVARTAQLRFPRRAAIWTAGAAPTHLLWVRSGVVRETIGHDAREVIVGFRGRGEVAGEVCALGAASGDTTEHHTDAVAHEEVSAYGLPIADLAEMLATDAVLVAHLASVAASRRRTVELRLASVPTRTAEARIAVALLELTEAFGVRDSRGVILNLRVTHRELAAMVGASRETASVAVAAWRRAGLLQVQDRRFVVLDPETLGSVAGGSVSYSGRA